MTKRLCLLLSLSLLLSCAPSATAPNQANYAGTRSGILPGSKGGILPGSKGSILPGSKGDRNLLPSLELELKLPVDAGFSVAQLAQADLSGWQAELDGLTAARLRVSAQSMQGDELHLSLVLEALEPLADSALHELILYSPAGVVQSAALVPAFSPGQTRLAAPLDSNSLADWLLAREYQRNLGQPLLQIQAATLRSLHESPEAAALAKTLKELYRSSKGKSDPIAATAAETKAGAAKMAGKAPEPGAAPAGKPAAAPSPGPSPGSSSGPSASPGAKPEDVGAPDTAGKPADAGKPEAGLRAKPAGL